MSTQQTVKIQLVRSPIGTKVSHRATVRGLGLRKAEQCQRIAGYTCSARHDQQDQLSGQNPLRGQ